MNGCDIALATLMREDPGAPCINYSWMTNTSYMSRVTGRDYWANREEVFIEYIRRTGVNLVPQWYFPAGPQQNMEQGRLPHAHHPGGSEQINSPDEILQIIDDLPSDAAVEADYDIESGARNYAATVQDRVTRLGGNALFIDGFGQADFMGGYSRWGYENYLVTIMDHPEAIRRYYHHTALKGRLENMGIALACEKYGIAPFVYCGQDICTSKGPIVSPEILRELYFPELKWALEPLVENGVGVIWHCDGNIVPILDDLLDLGVIGLQGFEEEHGVSYDEIVKLKDFRGRPIVLLGCVSVTSTLPRGTVDDVRRAVERSFLLAGRGRGFVLSSTSSVMPDVPHANIDMLFEHGRAFGAEYFSAAAAQ